MRAVLAVAARERVVAVRLPLIRPCGATFPRGGRLGGSHPRQINFFAIASASPKFIDTITPESELPKTLTSYLPCFRKEKGAHGIEERGVYRIHQFEKQEMIVVCKPEESKEWYDKLWKNTVDLFRSLDIPVRTLECCSGDLADLKVKSCDVEAWSPRQKKYFEVGSCSNLGDAQARRLGIRVKGVTETNISHTH